MFSHAELDLSTSLELFPMYSRIIKEKMNIAKNLIEEVQISEKLLKGKQSLIESTTKCLKDLDNIWMQFPQNLSENNPLFALNESANIQLTHCTEKGSPWILRHTPSIHDYFNIFEVVGSPGAYGIVHRGINKETGEEFAIKHINKRRYKNKRSQKIYFNDLRSEVYLMHQASEHPHIINVYHVFEDIDTLYLVLEYCKGGELYDALLKNRQHLTEIIVSNFFRQMVSSIYYLHSLGIAHCDLKPENFVFKDKARTQLILIDFGMSKIIEYRKYFKTIAGSPYYVAPEVLRNNYNEACDIWSLGVCLYIMIFGFCPFSDPNNDENVVYQKILRGFEAKVKSGYGAWFPDKHPVSRNCRDVIARMLRKNYADRITSEEILEHPWLKCNEILGISDSNKIESTTKLINISNPAILNSLRFYKKQNVLQGEVLNLLSQCKYLNRHQQNSLKEFLMATDENKDDKIEPKELFCALQKIDKDITMQDVQSIFHSIDANNDGFVSYDELLSTRINRKLKSKESRLKKVFKSFDYNGDGKITLSELKAVWESVIKGSANSCDFKKLIKEVDTNNDGTIDYEEFMAVFGKLST
eukprot:268164_1